MPAGATAGLIEALRRFKRQALHAVRLNLTHPTSGAELDFEAAMPEDLATLIGVLRDDNNAR